jgi:hypothetical protein
MATQTVENTTANVAIARAAYEAYVTKNQAVLEKLIAEDFHFTSPLDNRLDRETYFRRCWPNSKVIEGFDFIHLVTNADRVFVTYEGRNTNGHRFRNTEILTIRDRHIVDVEVYFGWSLPSQSAAGRIRERSRAPIATPRSTAGPTGIPVQHSPSAQRDPTIRRADGAGQLLVKRVAVSHVE